MFSVKAHGQTVFTYGLMPKVSSVVLDGLEPSIDWVLTSCLRRWATGLFVQAEGEGFEPPRLVAHRVQIRLPSPIGLTFRSFVSD